MTGRRRAGLIALLAVLVGGSLGCGWRWWAVRRDREAMAEIEEEMEAGRYAVASRDLGIYLARQPDSDEALYRLGTCEAARGRAAAADEFWSRVPPDSSFGARAIFGRLQLQMDRGSFTGAERLIRERLDDPRVDTASVPILLSPVYSNQGRIEETLRLVEARWNRLESAGEGASEAAIHLVRAHIALRQDPPSVEVIRSILGRAGELAPEDDRVWLGKANLAIRTGAYDEADRWIAACLRRHPDDIPSWRARLDWAIASGRPEEAEAALAHLPAAMEPPVRIPRIAAWLAARRGDPQAEARALERLVAIEPGDFAAVDRLAELSARLGRPGRAEELRRREAETRRLVDRYVVLFGRNQPRRDADEMSRLAERLGRRFEARAFAAIAASADPDDPEDRRRPDELARPAPTTFGPGATLAEAVAAESG